MTLYDRIAKLRPAGDVMSPAGRIYCELKYAAELSTVSDGRYDALLDAAAVDMLVRLRENGALTISDALELEQTLSPLRDEAKRYTAHCVGHAHIDMNWMWGYNETACLTVDTFRTVLRLMDEYPGFTFSQSQASTYKIIEDYAPDMLEVLKQRVHEGRWELIASTWVENDKNMPTGEALCRHILYTKRYLAGLFDILPDSIEIDFEPDTFGHAATVPEICAKGGIKYYYHCRGRNADPMAYRWRGKSDGELLVYNEPHWYNTQVEPVLFTDYPQRLAKIGAHDFLMVYGVGDHGGGPTRRDIERILEIASWPIMPKIEFSTYHRFFKRLEASKASMPLVEGELNYTFTGCYTSQSRIKLADSYAQARIKEAELLCAASRLYAGDADRSRVLDKAWQGILFNQFHDILPGSGTVETREFAMGEFQRAMAGIQASSSCALHSLSKAIRLPAAANEDESGTFSDGAGVGFRVGEDGKYRLPSSARGRGKTRYFALFNTAQEAFDGVAEITVWDWPYDEKRAVFTDADGSKTDSAVTGSGSRYWTHDCKTFAVRVSLPALGYAVYTLTEKPIENNRVRGIGDTRTDDFGDDDIVLENEYVRAVFDRQSMLLTSFRDRLSGEELIKGPTGAFTFIKENTHRHMTSWRVGERMSAENINLTRPVRVEETEMTGLRQSARYTVSFGKESSLQVRIILDAGSRFLRYDVNCDFQETGSEEATPQLGFEAALGYACGKYRYDIPYGFIDRAALAHDVPAVNLSCALKQSGASLMLMSDCKHGFRGCGDTLSLSLLRGSWDPDPYPENGKRSFSLALAAVSDPSYEALKALSDRLIHVPAVCACEAGEGVYLEPRGTFIGVTGARAGAIKTGSAPNSLVLRLVNAENERRAFSVRMPCEIASACKADINETPGEALACKGGEVDGEIGPGQVETLLLALK